MTPTTCPECGAPAIERQPTVKEFAHGAPYSTYTYSPPSSDTRDSERLLERKAAAFDWLTERGASVIHSANIFHDYYYVDDDDGLYGQEATALEAVEFAIRASQPRPQSTPTPEKK